MKENIEEVIEYLDGIDIKIFLSGMAEQSNYIVGKANEVNEAVELLLSDYKRVLKENAELKEERDAIYSDYQDLGKEKWEADEAILFLTERLENSISKQKIKDKIEELNKKEKQELKGTKGQDRYSIKQQYMYQRNVLQDLLEEKGE